VSSTGKEIFLPLSGFFGVFFFFYSPWLCNQFLLTACHSAWLSNQFWSPFVQYIHSTKSFQYPFINDACSLQAKYFYVICGAPADGWYIVIFWYNCRKPTAHVAPVRISIRTPSFLWLVIYTPYIPFNYGVLTHGNIT